MPAGRVVKGYSFANAFLRMQNSKGLRHRLIHSSIAARLVLRALLTVQNHVYEYVLGGLSSGNPTHCFAGLTRRNVSCV